MVEFALRESDSLPRLAAMFQARQDKYVADLLDNVDKLLYPTDDSGAPYYTDGMLKEAVQAVDRELETARFVLSELEYLSRGGSSRGRRARCRGLGHDRWERDISERDDMSHPDDREAYLKGYEDAMHVAFGGSRAAAQDAA